MKTKQQAEYLNVKILIVDDKPENLFSMQAALKGMASIFTALSGNDALSSLIQHDFALILLDVCMPDMDGFELAALVRGNEQTQHIPIIFVTAISQDQTDIFNGYHYGAVDYLLKPFDVDILKSKVAVFVELGRQKQLLHDNNQHLLLEIAERKRVGQELNHYRIRLEEMVESRTAELKKTTVSKDYVDNIIQCMIDTLIVINAKGRIRSVNPSTLQLLGYEERELLGKSYAKIIFEATDEEPSAINKKPSAINKEPSATDKEPSSIIQQLREKGSVRGIEQTYITKDGRKIPMLFSGSVMEKKSPAAQQEVVCVAQDLIAHKEAELQRATLREKEVYLKEIHHRVKNNLSIISSLLELQSAYIKDPQALGFFKNSQDRIKVMALIHDLLYQSDSLADIGFAGYLRRVVESLLSTYDKANQVKLELNIEEVRLEIDTAIPCGLVVNELVTNALKYAFPGQKTGTLSVSFSLLPEHRLELIVADNGIGLPADFDIYQSSSLGLQLVTDLVEEQMEGEVGIQSENGSRFTLRFAEHRQRGQF